MGVSERGTCIIISLAPLSLSKNFCTCAHLSKHGGAKSERERERERERESERMRVNERVRESKSVQNTLRECRFYNVQCTPHRK